MSFIPVAEPSADSRDDLPSRVFSLDRGKLFRAVDAGPVPAKGWDDIYGKAMDVACARTGPVLRPNAGGFFSVVIDDVPSLRGMPASRSLAVIAAAGAVAAARDRSVVPTCETSLLPGPCPEIVADLARRPPDEVRAGRCAASRQCMEVRYDQGWLHWLTLTIERDFVRGPGAYDDAPTSIRAIRVTEVHAVE